MAFVFSYKIEPEFLNMSAKALYNLMGNLLSSLTPATLSYSLSPGNTIDSMPVYVSWCFLPPECLSSHPSCPEKSGIFAVLP